MFKKIVNKLFVGSICLFASSGLVTIVYINFFKYQVYLQFEADAPKAAERFEIYINSDGIRPYVLPIQNKKIYEVNLGSIVPHHIKLDWLGLSGTTIKFNQIKLVVKKNNQVCDVVKEIDLKKSESFFLENANITQNDLIKNSGNSASLSFGVNFETQTTLQNKLKRSEFILKNAILVNFAAICLLLFFCFTKYADQLASKKLKDLCDKKELVFLCLLLGITLPLRFAALKWEIPNKENSLMGSLDEVAITNAVLSINWTTGNIVGFGYREGSFMYYIWAFSIDLAHSLGFVKTGRNDIQFLSPEYGKCVFFMRCANALFATGTSVLIFLLCLRWKIKPFYGFLSSLSYLAIPIVLLWDTLARTHGPANFLLLFTIYLSTFKISNTSNIKFIFLGILCGICTSIRYTMIFSLIAPILSLLKYQTENKIITKARISKGLLVIFLSFSTAFIIMQPGFVLDFSYVKYLLDLQSQYIPENLGKNFFEIIGIKNVILYIFHLIPIACTKTLSIIFILCFVLTLLTRSIKLVYPLAIFCLFYLFFVSIFYPFGFLRTLYPLFAFFPLLIGLALQDIHKYNIFSKFVCGLTTCLLLYLLKNSIEIKSNLCQKTARTEVVEIFKNNKNIKKGSNVFFFEKYNSWDACFPIIQATHGSIQGIWISENLFSDNSTPAVTVFFTKSELEKSKKTYDNYKLLIVYSSRNQFICDLNKIPWEYSLFFPNFIIIDNKT